MPREQKKVSGMAMIDVSLVVIRTGSEDDGIEYALDTANKVGVETQTETKEAIKVVKDGKLLAQKPEKVTITGTKLTITDNLFTPTIMKILQGGQIEGENESMTYTPPVAGSGELGEIFETDCYSAQYDASGQIVKYEKITYPNCQGTPVAVNSEDDVFRVPEYVINSAPNTGEAPYKISYTKTLPDFGSAQPASVMSMSEETGLSKMN